MISHFYQRFINANQYYNESNEEFINKKISSKVVTYKMMKEYTLGFFTQFTVGVAAYVPARSTSNAILFAAQQFKWLTPAIIKQYKYNTLPLPSSLLIRTARAVFILGGVPGEECLCRFIIQDYILKQKVPEYVEKLSGKKIILTHDPLAWKITRIVLSSLAFSLFHLENLRFLPKEVVIFQCINTIGLGLVCGTLKETVGLTASIGLHMFWNTIHCGI